MPTVLVIDDDPLQQMLAQKALEGAGHTVLLADDGARGLESVKARKPDVAFIDLQLADGHTGASIAQALQSLGVKVIVLSGHPNVGAGLGTVPHTYAAKPVHPDMVELLLNPQSDKPRKRRKGFAGPPLATA